MKKVIALIFALFFIFVFVSCEEDNEDTIDKTSNPTQSEGNEITFVVQNETELDIKSLSISEADKNKWSENLLTKTMEAYSSTTLKIKVPKNKETGFELLATDTSDETTTFRFLDLSEVTEKGGSIFLTISEGGSAHASFQPPYTEPTLVLDSAPTKINYKVGEGYDPSGFSATYTDEDGVATKLEADDVKFIVSNTVEITTGRPFTSAGKKVVVIEHSGLKIEFELIVE